MFITYPNTNTTSNAFKFLYNIADVQIQQCPRQLIPWLMSYHQIREVYKNDFPNERTCIETNSQ